MRSCDVKDSRKALRSIDRKRKTLDAVSPRKTRCRSSERIEASDFYEQKYEPKRTYHHSKLTSFSLLEKASSPPGAAPSTFQ